MPMLATRVLHRVIAILVLTPIIVLIAPTAHAVGPCPLFGAHRGTEWPTPYTEDSRGAMQAAAADPGVYHRENDVYVTSDGVGVMNHDATWDRTMEKEAVVIRDHTLAWTLANIRLEDGSVPLTVQEYINSIAQTRKPSYIHIKVDAAVPDVARRLRAAQVQKWTRVIAQSPTILRHFHRLASGYHMAYVVPGSRAPQVSLAGEFAGRVLVWGDSPYPVTNVRAYIDAGMQVEMVANNDEMIEFSRKFNPPRVLTANVARAREIYGCPA